MQFSTSATIVALASLAQYVVADSEKFGLIAIRSGSRFQNTGVAQDGDALALTGSNYISATIDEEGNLKIDDKYVSVNNGALTVGSDKSSGFSIKGGYLAYESSQAFTVDDSNYHLIAGSGSNPVGLHPILENGSAASDFTPSGSSSDSPANNSTSNSTSSSITPPVYTQTDNGAAGFAQVGLGAGLAAVAALLI